MVEWQGTKELVEHFAQYLSEGRLVDETGLVHAPWYMVDWSIYVDGEKAQGFVRIPADNQDHVIDLYGAAGYGHVWAKERVRPKLKIVG